MALDADLRTEILAASTTLGNRCHYNFVPQQQANVFPRAWYQRSDREDEVDIDGSRGLLSTVSYNVECISSSLSQAITAADAIRTTLNGKYGTFGAGTVKGVFVEDQDDQYIPRGTGEDAGLHVSALLVRIMST